MPEANPVWGVHVVEGSLTAALVRRTETGNYEILDAIAERTPDDPALAMRQARAVLSRRGVAARGALVTLPDANGSLVTATVPPDEFDLSEHEISNEMYEWTRFEPDQAELRHNCVLREGRRRERLVGAIPRPDYRRYLEILETGDVSRLGVGLSGVATWRGALAMGLCPPDGFLVATLPHATEVYTAPDGRARRSLIAVGEADITRDATAVDVLARDLAQLADYHRALRRAGDRPPADPKFALAGLSAASPAVRHRLAAVLGPRLCDGAALPSRVTVAAGARLPNVPVAALTGAVGAALEALRPAAERLVLRHLPADLPPYRERSLGPYVAAAAAALVGGLLLVQRLAGDADLARGPAPPPVAHETATAPAVVPEPPVEKAAPLAEPVPPVPVRALDLELAGEGRVRVRWHEGAAGRTLRRRLVGQEGEPPDHEPVELRQIDAGAGEFVDDVPGASGLYAWSTGEFDEARLAVDIAVDIDLLGPGDAGGARFALRRPWRGGTATLEVDIAPGRRVRGADGLLTFFSNWRLDAVRTRVDTERAVVIVPRFLPDGRVERGGDGIPVTDERVIERERRIFEADGVAPDKTRRTWTRKMTDG